MTETDLDRAIAAWARDFCAAQTPVEPDFAAFLYHDRSAMYVRDLHSLKPKDQ